MPNNSNRSGKSQGSDLVQILSLGASIAAGIYSAYKLYKASTQKSSVPIPAVTSRSQSDFEIKNNFALDKNDVNGHTSATSIPPVTNSKQSARSNLTTPKTDKVDILWQGSNADLQSDLTAEQTTIKNSSCCEKPMEKLKQEHITMCAWNDCSHICCEVCSGSFPHCPVCSGSSKLRRSENWA